jgi:hemerythrin superfamily protein
MPLIAATKGHKPEAKHAPAAKAGTTGKTSPTDAISLLKADHREVKGWFEAYEGSSSKAAKAELSSKICAALKVHSRIEEEIFYPAARAATKDDDLLDEELVEHAAAKDLIAQIETMSVGDDLYDAKVKVLSEEILHHVKEEEGELFPEVKASKLDLDAVGAKLAKRKAELTR